ALDHVGQVRAHEAVLRAVLALVVRAQDRDLVGLGLDGHTRRYVLRELALRTLDADRARLLGQGHALRQRQNLSSDAAHYQTSHSSSPPRPSLRAARSVIRPFEVDRMAMPRPERTLGIVPCRTYIRCPGRDRRRRPVMALVRGPAQRSQTRISGKPLKSSRTS